MVHNSDIFPGTNVLASLSERAPDIGTNKIHIRNQQRNGRKSLTTVQGIDQAYDLKRICAALKKEFSCNGTVIEDEEWGLVIQLQGDHRQDVATFLKEQEIVRSLQDITIHGA